MAKRIMIKLKLIFIPCLENNYRPKFLESKFLFYYLLLLLILKFITVSYLIYLPKTIFFADISSAGENLAIGFLDSEEVYQAWNNSPSHKANLFNPNYQDIGITVLKGDFQGNETYVVVQLFGAPKTKQAQKEQATEVEETPKIPAQGGPTGQEIIQEKPPIEIEQEVASEEVVDKLEEPLTEGYVFSAENIETENEFKNSFRFNFFQFLSSDYNNIVQKIIFYSLLFITLSLILNICVEFNIQHKELIIKTLFFVTLLTLFIIFDKELIIRILPHNFNIF